MSGNNNGTQHKIPSVAPLRASSPHATGSNPSSPPGARSPSEPRSLGLSTASPTSQQLQQASLSNAVSLIISPAGDQISRKGSTCHPCKLCDGGVPCGACVRAGDKQKCKRSYLCGSELELMAAVSKMHKVYERAKQERFEIAKRVQAEHTKLLGEFLITEGDLIALPPAKRGRHIESQQRDPPSRTDTSPPPDNGADEMDPLGLSGDPAF